jgi:acetolactate synthase I/II/III large subunit
VLTASGGEALVRTLIESGVDHVFCVPGESFLSALNAMYGSTAQLRVITCRHEGAAANMAEAYGRLTGRPGVCFVTRGPGATHASVGVHTAEQGSSPMLLLVGQIPRGHTDRRSLQEVDYKQFFGGMAKFVAEVPDAGRIPEYVNRALRLAVSGEAGPVVLSLPEDVLTGQCTLREPHRSEVAQPRTNALSVTEIEHDLAEAARPLMVVGGSGWNEQACADAVAYAEANRLPVATAFRRQDLFDNYSPSYIGELGMEKSQAFKARVRDSDLLLVIGARLDETTTGGYELIDPDTAPRLIHAHPNLSELGTLYQPARSINATPGGLLAALRETTPIASPPWAEGTVAAHADYIDSTTPIPATGDVNLAEIIAHLVATLPDDAILTHGAGNYASWIQRFYRFGRSGTLLAPPSGAMGYGLPAAIMAKLVHPERDVVSISGDGCFQMYPQELATAVQFGAAITAIVVNNGSYGTIRMHQERAHPGRVIATELRNPDFAALARAYGAHGETVETTEDFPAAFKRVHGAGRPALIEVRTSIEDVRPGLTLDQVRADGRRTGPQA